MDFSIYLATVVFRATQHFFSADTASQHGSKLNSQVPTVEVHSFVDLTETHLISFLNNLLVS